MKEGKKKEERKNAPLTVSHSVGIVRSYSGSEMVKPVG
jgi:hypothetical protein